MADEVIVLITASSKEEASHRRALVDEHLVLREYHSGSLLIVFLGGKTQDARETLLIVKSRLSLMDKIIARMKIAHSYSVPEVIALPIIAGSQEYLDWVEASTV